MSLRDFEFLEKIGEGAYSTVWKVRRYSDSKVYALKKARMSKLKEKERLNSLNEVRFLASINHPNVISYKEAFFDSDTESLCIVMEFASEGDLYQKIQSQQKLRQYMSESFVWRLLISVTQGLKALHDLNIMHRDLKSANVFVLDNSRIKLGDMNVSKLASEGMLHTQTGTPYYASPEVWRDAPYDTKSDIWSLGCVLYEACALKPPFKADDMKGLFKKVTRGEYPALPRSFSKELESVIGQMIQVDPSHRPSCDTILRIPAVARRNVDYEVVREPSPLIKEIPLPKNLDMMSESLPRSNYRERLSKREDSLKYRTRNNHSEIDYRRFYRSEETPLSHNRIMKDNYGALKLPRIKYPQSPEKSSTFKIRNRDSLRNVSIPRRALGVPSWWG